MVTIFEQGDIVYLDFDPQSGHEQNGRRPALVISNNLFNRVSSLTMVCPITHTDRGHPFHLRLDERTRTDGVILCDQARMLDLDNAFHRRAFELCGMEGHFDHMLSTFQHIERLRKFSLQTDENKSVCGAHTRILEAVLHGTEEDVSRALSEHLHRYKLSVDQARAAHPDYFIGNGDTW